MAGPADDTALPQATLEPAPRARFSPVWIVPLVAVVVAVGIFADRVLSEGPTVSIVFASAEGIEAGKTFVKYKDVNIGQVTGVRLTEDFGRVEVTARIAKSAAGLMVEDAKFWVVRPRISLSGVSGLSTLLSGDYIGFEAGASGKRQKSFTGLEVPPIITGGAGRRFVLDAADLGSLGIGSPVYFRRLPVGQVVAFDLAADGKSVAVTLFVNAPYDKYVTTGTRFWNASGVDVSLTASGIDVRTQSLVALLEGGLAFETPAYAAAAPQAAAGASFRLFADRATAMKPDDTIATRYVLHFSESLRGLSVGAPVMFFGVGVGEVVDIGLAMDERSLNVRPRVDIVVYPERMISALPAAQERLAQPLVANRDYRHAIMRRMVQERGLRAQLMTGSLITGQLYVALGYFPDAKPARFDPGGNPPELPVVASPFPALEAKLSSIVAKLDKVPLDAIGDELKQALATLDQTLKDVGRMSVSVETQAVPALRSALDDARGALAATERVMGSAENNLVGSSAPGQIELRNALQELARAARSLRVLADYLERHPESLIRGKTPEGAPK
ncbi:MAG: MlaD family protein [Burkholderiales bacterium]